MASDAQYATLFRRSTRGRTYSENVLGLGPPPARTAFGGQRPVNFSDELSDSHYAFAFEDPRNIDFNLDQEAGRAPSSNPTVHFASLGRASLGKKKFEKESATLKRRASTSIFGTLMQLGRKGKGKNRKISISDFLKSATRKEGVEHSESGGKDANGEIAMRAPYDRLGEWEDKTWQRKWGEPDYFSSVDDVFPSVQDPFKTPPSTPMSHATSPPQSPFCNTSGSPDSTSRSFSFSLKRSVTPGSPGSPDSMRSSFRRMKLKRARLMSRMKSVQILGPEASGVVRDMEREKKERLGWVSD